MHVLRRESGHADREVLGPAGRGVTHPGAGLDDHRLPRFDVHLALGRLQYERPFENDGVLVESGRLAGLAPAGGG